MTGPSPHGHFIHSSSQTLELFSTNSPSPVLTAYPRVTKHSTAGCNHLASIHQIVYLNENQALSLLRVYQQSLKRIIPARVRYYNNVSRLTFCACKPTSPGTCSDLGLHCAPSPGPDPAARPLECGPYVEQLEHTARLIAVYSFSIVGLFLSSLFLTLFIILCLKNDECNFIKRLAEATPEEREEELMRICKEAHIKLERRENGRSEKMDDLQEV